MMVHQPRPPCAALRTTLPRLRFCRTWHLFGTQIQDFLVDQVGGQSTVVAACGKANRSRLCRWRRGISVDATPLGALTAKSLFVVHTAEHGAWRVGCALGSGSAWAREEARDCVVCCAWSLQTPP